MNSQDHQDNNDLLNLDFNKAVDTTNNKSKTYRIDYNAIRTRYMAGDRILRDDGVVVIKDLSLKDVSQEFNVNYSSVLLKAKKEEWSKLKQAFRAKLGEVATEQQLNLYLDQNLVADIQAINTANKLTKLYNAYLEAKFGEILSDLEDETISSLDPQIILDTIDLKDMKELIAIAKEIYNLTRSVTDSREKGLENRSSIMKEAKQLANKTGRNILTPNTAQIEALQQKMKLLGVDTTIELDTNNTTT